MHVLHAETQRMEVRKLTYVPGLYKCFDEIVVNAADNKVRDDSQTYIKIKVERDKGRLSVENDGKGIPIVMHKEHQVYVPTLIFGHLLAGSNFNDGEKKLTGGRNGYGAKLANIFSTEFIVETADTSNGKLFRQVFKDNMKDVGKPTITDLKEGATDFTRITWTPDLAKFGLHMGLKCLTNVDLLAADLIAHDASFAQVTSPGLPAGAVGSCGSWLGIFGHIRFVAGPGTGRIVKTMKGNRRLHPSHLGMGRGGCQPCRARLFQMMRKFSPR
jgi:hypothetical protein